MNKVTIILNGMEFRSVRMDRNVKGSSECSDCDFFAYCRGGFAGWCGDFIGHAYHLKRVKNPDGGNNN